MTIFGQNLAGAQVSLNDVAVAVAFGNANQINFFVPPGFATGPATLKVTSASGAAFPIALQIDAPPPVITGVNDARRISRSARVPAARATFSRCVVTGLDPAVVANSRPPARDGIGDGDGDSADHAVGAGRLPDPGRRQPVVRRQPGSAGGFGGRGSAARR